MNHRVDILELFEHVPYRQHCVPDMLWFNLIYFGKDHLYIYAVVLQLMHNSQVSGLEAMRTIYQKVNSAHPG